jgi:hypothetical protein
MKKLSFWTSLALMVLGSLWIVGCGDSEAGGDTNAQMMEKGNKGLPPDDPSKMNTIPQREDMKGGNMPQKGGK